MILTYEKNSYHKDHNEPNVFVAGSTAGRFDLPGATQATGPEAVSWNTLLTTSVADGTDITKLYVAEVG
jgi:hypothetical protein